MGLIIVIFWLGAHKNRAIKAEYPANEQWMVSDQSGLTLITSQSEIVINEAAISPNYTLLITIDILVQQNAISN